MTELGAAFAKKPQSSGHEVQRSEFNVLIVRQYENDVGLPFSRLPDDVVDGGVLGENTLDNSDAALLDSSTAVVRSANSTIG